MNNKPISNPSTIHTFALDLARATARSLFNTSWYGAHEIPEDPEEPDEADFVASLPEDLLQPASKPSWEAPETPMANSMSDFDIATAIRAGQDPLAQHSEAEGRVLRRGNPPPSLIAAAFAAAQIVSTAEICVLGAPSSGAGVGENSDLAQATSVAMYIERQWGLGETGLLWDGEAATNIWSIPGYVRRRAEQHLMEAERNALALIKEHKAQLIALAKHLLRVREMTAHDLELFQYYHHS